MGYPLICGEQVLPRCKLITLQLYKKVYHFSEFLHIFWIILAHAKLEDDLALKFIKIKYLLKAVELNRYDLYNALFPGVMIAEALFNSFLARAGVMFLY